MDATLRAAATAAGIPAVTLEIGDPHRLQPALIRSSLNGRHRALVGAHLLSEPMAPPGPKAVFCERSYWLHTDRGGLLEVLPRVTDRVAKGELIARLRNGFGDVVREYLAPEDGVVVEASAHPVGHTGARILHLGVIRRV
jgi:predicted deacylase